MSSTACIVCGQPGHPFCASHVIAPSGKKGGWLSSYRRTMAMSGAPADAEPLEASCVVRRLWVGSKPPVDRVLPAFSMIVLAAKEYQPTTAKWAGRVLHVPLDDAEPSQAEILRAVTAAREVAAEMRRGGRVLSTCAMGLNRSAWIAAQAILMTRPKATPAAAIKVIRARRDAACLSNPYFVKSIESIWSSRMLSPRR